MAMPGVVDQDVEPPEALGDLGDRLLGGLTVGHVELHELGFAARLLDGLRGFARGAFVAHVVDDDVRAALGQRHDCRSADAARTAGDECYFAAEIEHAVRCSMSPISARAPCLARSRRR